MKKQLMDKNQSQPETTGVYQILYKSLRPPKLKPDASLHKMKSMMPISVNNIHRSLIKEESQPTEQA